jgi:NAD(P) transhydrogenase subunit beta
MMSEFASTQLIEVTYLIATALFIWSLKWMSSPATARRGVWAGELGMLLAVAGTLLHSGIVDYKWLAAALVLGTIIGVPLGKVAMTAVPQRTALSHAFGALCVTLVGTAEFYLRAPSVPPFMMAVLGMEVILGSLTFTGSLMAAGKLQEVLPQRPITYKGQNFVNLAVLAIAVYFPYKMFTARAAIKTIIVSEISDCAIIPSLAPRVSTAVSVGENAVLVLNAKKR